MTDANPIGEQPSSSRNAKKFTAAERAWLDEVRDRWTPLTEPQAAVLRRLLGSDATATTTRAGDAA